MLKALLHIYDFFTAHKPALWICFAVLMVPLLFLALSLRYDEDIMDFLPVTEEDRVVLDALQNQQEASRIVLIVEGEDEDRRLEALDEITFHLSPFTFQLSTYPIFNFQFSIFNFHFPTRSSRPKPCTMPCFAISLSSLHPAHLS